MENVSNISSEEELLGLRDEGKISEDEYQELLGAMRKRSQHGGHDAAPATDEEKSKRRLGKTAFVLMLTGIVVPIVSFFVAFAITHGGEGDVIFSSCLVLCVVIEMPAFVFGVISWPDVFGKTTVATILTVAALWVSCRVLQVLGLLYAR